MVEHNKFYYLSYIYYKYFNGINYLTTTTAKRLFVDLFKVLNIQLKYTDVTELKI